MSDENDKNELSKAGQNLPQAFSNIPEKSDKDIDPVSRIANAIEKGVNTLDNKISADKEVRLKELSNEERNIVIEERRVKIEEEKIANESRQQTFGNIVIVLLAATFFALGIFNQLNIESAMFIIMLIFIAPKGINSLRDYLS